jgi:cytochrome c-type biogenesis protein CcmH
MRLAIAVIAALLVTTGTAFAQAKTSMPDVEDEVMCVSCKVPLYIAESPQADRQRAFIQTLVDQGLTKEQIKDRLVGEYGQNVLAMPDDDGVGIAAYVVPIAVVLALLGLVAVLVPRWRRAQREQPEAQAAGTPAATDEELERLDEELQRVG